MRQRPRLSRLVLPTVAYPDALDETVVHDPAGRPWLVCTTDRWWQREHQLTTGMAELEALPPLGALDARYETQVFYTARAGIRGFPTGHLERYDDRDAAVSGHRRWCLHVRHGEICPDLPPDEPL